MAGLTVDALRELATDEADFDFIIECKDVKFKVHRLILKAGSQFFRAVCTNNCRENTNSKCQLPEDDPETIGRVIQFLYTGWYPADGPAFVMPSSTDQVPTNTTSPAPETVTDDDSDEPSDPDGQTWMFCGRAIAELKVHTLVYQAADKLGIPNLKESSLENVRSGYMEFLVDHPNYAGLLELVYTTTHSTDDGLRFFMTERTLNSPWFLSHERLARIIEQHESMAYRVWRKTGEDFASRRRIRKMQRRKQNAGELIA